MKNPFQQTHKQVSIFITAGFTELNSLPGQLLSLQEKGVDFIEIGMPFSDPMADGPVIQHCSSVALQNGMTPDVLFAQLESIRDKIHIPLVLMGYFNPVLQYGIPSFLEKCRQLRITSLILPDLPLELYLSEYKELVEGYGISITFLITPQTSDERIRQIAATCKNSFVYLVGQNSITGTTYTISEQQLGRYAEIKQLCGETPIMLGFGIDSYERKQQAFLHCDGAIIGTAYLKALQNGAENTFLNTLLATSHSEPVGQVT